LHFHNLAGAAPATSDVLGPRLIAAPQQQETLVPQQAMDCYQLSQHDGVANAFTSAFNGLSLRDDHPGCSATAVEAASSDNGNASDNGNVFLCSACSGLLSLEAIEEWIVVTLTRQASLLKSV
jgi:hypothetical protein